MKKSEVERLMQVIERSLGKGWVDLADWLRSLPENQLSAIEAKIAAGNYAEVVSGIQDAALRWAAETQTAYTGVAQTAAKWLDDQPALESKLIQFDVADSRIVDRAKRNRLEHVYGFQQEANQTARQITRRALTEAASTGVNPRRIAQDFRDSIGLAPVQEQWVANYRRALEQGDYTGAASRELSSGHSDRTLARLARDGGSLTPAQVDTMVERYRQNAITYRAETIARTESLRNVHEGIADSFDQAIRRGDLDADQLVKEWIPGPRTKDARPMHQAMRDKTAPWGQPFVLPDGVRMQHPGDDAGGAEHNANCRCTMATTMA